MGNVAIFADYENLSFVLQKREFCRILHQEFGEELRKLALQHGTIEHAMMWAEWDRHLPGKRQEQSAQAILTGLGFDCLYLLRPAERSYTEQAILKKLTPHGNGLQHVFLLSGDYTFPELLAWLKVPVTLLTLAVEEPIAFPKHVKHISLLDILDRDTVCTPIHTPKGMEPAAFYIAVQRILQEELQRRNWQGMSFHMMARLLIERGLCEEEVSAQFYINQAVRENFLERTETELPTGRRVLLRPNVVDRSNDPSWQEDPEFCNAQLIWALDIILSRNPWWEYVTFSRLREELEKWSLLHNANELQQIIEQAVARGLYKLDVEEGGAPLFRKKYKYTLAPPNPESEMLRLVPRLILQTIRRLLQENPHWHGVSFSKLLDELSEHANQPELQPGQGSFWLDRQRLKEWCNFLVTIGFLHAFRGRTRPVDGEHRDPPTLLRAVPEHAWIQWVDEKPLPSGKAVEPVFDFSLEPEDPAERNLILKDLDYYRLVVVIEHYLHISNNDAVVAGWMPMSTLFHVMGRSLDRAFCNAIVRSAREKEILEIRTHDPRPGQHPARGAHLDLDNPIVTEARKRLLRCLEILQNIQDRDGTVNLYTFEEKLRQDPFFGETEEERLGWIELMREENLILLRPVHLAEVPEASNTQTQTGTPLYQCTLNFRDRYVLALLETLSPTDTLLGPETPAPKSSYTTGPKETGSPLPHEDFYKPN